MLTWSLVIDWSLVIERRLVIDWSIVICDLMLRHDHLRVRHSVFDWDIGTYRDIRNKMGFWFAMVNVLVQVVVSS